MKPGDGDAGEGAFGEGWASCVLAARVGRNDE